VQILVFGAGAMGSFFGGLLAARQDVLLVGRREHMDAIHAHGLRISGKTARIARPESTTRIPASAHPELVLVATKAYDTEAAMASLKRFARSALFVTLQNGLDNAEVIARTASRVIAGTTSHGVTFLGPGEVRHAGIGDTTIGAWAGVDEDEVVRVRDIFEEAGVRTRIADDIKKELWAKLVVNASINPLAALAGVANGRLVQDKGLQALLEAVGREAVAVGRADGIDLDADELVRRTRLVARRTAGNRASMLQDLDRHRRTEIDAITGAILRTAERRGVDAPLNRALLALVRAREAESLRAE
jgi:2-dehydropantoate 2-reductase